MNDKELIGNVHSAVYHQCRSRGFAAPVDVLMDVGYLSKQDYENWRYGRVDYLERVCKANRSKLSLVMSEMRSYGKKAGLKPSFCYYKRWGTKKKNGQGHKPVIPLRFSKSGNPEIERWYATRYVDLKRTNQLKAERARNWPVSWRARTGMMRQIEIAEALWTDFSGLSKVPLLFLSNRKIC